jgi:RimJ/RimL family protein N-acetyltransferase
MTTQPDAIDLTPYRREEILRDGYRVLLRPIEKSDVQLWLDFISRLSPNTLYYRFHYIPKQMTEEDALRYCTVDYVNSYAYVAEIGYGKERKIIAISRYYRLPNKHSAEVAFAIEDTYHRYI